MTINKCVICLSVFNMEMQCLLANVPTTIKKETDENKTPKMQ